jgi:hypothetical protein
MGHIDTCLGILRRLIAKGDMNGIPLAERAINEYWDATSAQVRKSGLRFLQLTRGPIDLPLPISSM